MATTEEILRLRLQGQQQTEIGLRRTTQAAQTMTGGFRGLAGAMAASGAGAGLAVAGLELVGRALRAVYDATEQLARGFHSLAMRGGGVAAVATAFDRLASPELLTRMRLLTGSLIDNQTLMQETNQVLLAGVVTGDQWADMLGRVTTLAQQTGRPVGEMAAQLASIASGGMPARLREIGVNVVALRDEVTSLGLSLETAAGQSVMMELVGEALAERTDGLTNASSNYSDAVSALTSELSNLRDAMGLQIATNDDLVTGIADTASGLQRLTPMLVDLADLAARTVVVALEAMGRALDWIASGFRVWADGARHMFTYYRVSGEQERFVVWLERTADAIQRIAGVRDAGARLREVTAAAGGAATGEVPTVARARARMAQKEREAESASRAARRGGGGRRAATASDEDASEAEWQARRREALEQVQALAAIEIKEAEERAATEQRLADEALQRVEDHVKAEEEAARRMIDLFDAQARARALALEIENDALEKNQRRVEQSFRAAETTEGVFGDLANAVKDSAGEQAVAYKALAAVEGAFLVGRNVAYAAQEAARAISSYPDFAAMAVHAAGAVAHTTAAVIAAKELGATLSGKDSAAKTANAAAGAGASSHRPEWAAGPAATPRGEGGLTIEVHGVITSERAVDEIEAAMRARNRARA